MSRVINTNNPNKIRNHCRRTIAELLRRLSKKSGVDEEAKDMAATIVYMLREINASVEQTVTAWEKRDYWMKAERFLREWEWARETEANLDDVIRNEAWDLLPRLLAGLFPRFTDVQVKRMTRPPSAWKGAYKQLLSDSPASSPW
ncbi:MAG TPA: hypothetical protein VK879_01380 [Candidatus Sulfomarinibacteraceae bacterium]|nr:hypothetical protein [Candidatus Sulfomarinibacteraceae bacterium]